jgi:hypothetical protein
LCIPFPSHLLFFFFHLTPLLFTHFLTKNLMQTGNGEPDSDDEEDSSEGADGEGGARTPTSPSE